jgi:hypothetical protein
MMRFEAKSVGRTKIPEDQRIVLEHAQLHGEDYSGHHLSQFVTIGCRLKDCHFDKAIIGQAALGSGQETSEYLDCTFDGAQLEMGPGGFARFVRCSFRDVDIRNWICFAVELIECTFSGRLKRAIFNGSVPERKQKAAGREQNEIRDNDFSAMDFIEVSFRTGVDLTLQRLPSGLDYLFLPDAAVAAKHAAIGIGKWDDLRNSRSAFGIVKVIEENARRGQIQMLLRKADFYSYPAISRDVVDRVFAGLHPFSETR